MADSTQDIHKYGTDDGWHGVIAEGGEFPPEKDRYHLYIGHFCPFAHRVQLIRHLKSLQPFITLSVVRPHPKEGGGWRFPSGRPSASSEFAEYPGATVDHLFKSSFLSEVYFRDDKEYKGKYSVPLLWDKKSNKIVNNESAEVLRWLPTAFDSLLPKPNGSDIDFYPQELKKTIDEWTPFIQSNINLGVYRAGFATTQSAYDSAVAVLFAALNKLEAFVHANGGPYILGKTLTELDVRVFTTIVRFDVIYVQHFKTNLGTIRHDYPVLANWLKGVFWSDEWKGFRETCDFKHIKENYTKSHSDINPLAITPMGPFPDVESGYESDWTKLSPGEIKHPAVLEAASKL
ncbi:unnamed protein product [Periconia digitata]|uniref:GST N-terminal domain-containing protein n=1 Tax=Periconia digitata TaxID=1303443 RepID=A0A9W4XWM1_9PLEO|nr:unnamed protein product [Periconia digitata]